VPTFAEAGLPEFQVYTWSGLSAPAGTPEPVVQRLYEHVAAILKTPETQKFMVANGAEPGGLPPAEFQARVKQETERWRVVAQYAGIEAE